MNLIKTFRIIIGVLLLLSTLTIFALLFLEIDSLAVLFNFGIDVSAGNIGEAIAGAVAGLVAGLIFFFAMVFVAIFNVIIYAVLGALTLALKRKKAMPIIVSIFTALALVIGISPNVGRIHKSNIASTYYQRYCNNSIVYSFSHPYFQG